MKVTATKLSIIVCALISIASFSRIVSLSSNIQKLFSFEDKNTIFLPPTIVSPSVDDDVSIANNNTSSGVTGPLFANDGVHDIVPPSVDDNVRIVHVISPYVIDTCDAPFCPVNQEQSLVMGSMLRAAGKSRGPVLLVAATLPEDAAAAPPDFLRLPLTRSTATAYPKTKKALPFIQDIFDGLRNRSSMLHYDYVIYTNADIIVHENFYNIVRKQIRAGYDSFQINRQTVIGGNINRHGDPYIVQDLDEIFASKKGRLHPGTDCFVIKKSVLEKVDMGNIFLGTPPFANMLILQTSYFAKETRKFGSFELKATYHLGNEMIWGKDVNLRLMKQNLNNVIALRSWIDLCSEEAKNHKDTGREKIEQYCIDLILKLEKRGDEETPLYVVQNRDVHSCQTGYSMITQVNSCVTSAKFLGLMYEDQDENDDKKDSHSTDDGLSNSACFASNIAWKGKFHRPGLPSKVRFGSGYGAYAGWVCQRDSVPFWRRPPAVREHRHPPGHGSVVRGGPGTARGGPRQIPAKRAQPGKSDATYKKAMTACNRKPKKYRHRCRAAATKKNAPVRISQPLTRRQGTRWHATGKQAAGGTRPTGKKAGGQYPDGTRPEVK